MATIEQLEDGLRKAHAAGNTEHARRFAAEIRRMRSEAPQADFSGVTGRARVLERASDPTEGMSTGERFAAGFGRSFAELGRGIKQNATDAAIGLGSAFAGAPEFRAALQQRAAPIQQRQQADIDAARALDAPLLNTGAGTAGNITGVISQILGPGLALRSTRAAAAFLPTTVAGNAAQGAALGGLQPTVTGESQLANAAMGGAAGGAGAAVFRGLGAGVGAIRNAVRGPDSVDRAAANVLTEMAERPAEILQRQPSAVPGVQRTLAEETLDPGIARLERNMRSTSNEFDTIDRSNNAARVSQLSRIAGTESEMASAEAARESATSSLRDQSFQEGRDFARMAGMMSDVERARLILQAQDVSAENLARQKANANASRVFMGSGSPPVMQELPVMTQAEIDSAARSVNRTGLEPLRNRLKFLSSQNAGETSVTSTLNRVGAALDASPNTLGGMYSVRKEINNLLSGKAGSDATASRSATRQLMQMRQEIDDEMTMRAPSFARYLSAYQDASLPINRMEIGRELMGRSSGGSVLDPVTGSQVLTPAQFSKMARDLDQVAAKATGFSKAKASDILNASDISIIKAIQDDLERQAFRATAGSGGGSPTFERLSLDQQLGRRAAGGLAAQIPIAGPYVRDLIGVLDRTRNDRVKERLAYLVANPDEARRVLQSLPASGRSIVEKALTQISGATAAGAAVGARDDGLELDIVGGTPVPADQF